MFNYHRIGDSATTLFDRAVFSCTKEALDMHVKLIKQNFTLITMSELRKLIDKGSKVDGRYAIITFDDGYYDNYSEAYPVLLDNNVSAVFYLVTDFVGSTVTPWWDDIAFILRCSAGQSYKLPKSNEVIYLDPDNIDKAIQQVIFKAKRIKNFDILQVLDDIRKCFPSAVKELSNKQESLFMSWEHAKEMTENGMEIGSHTLSHRMLAQLSAEEQEQEIKRSKALIEEKLDITIDSIAYPVGRYHCYTQGTCEITDRAGYLIGFNNEPGRNNIINNPFDINRICVDEDDVNQLKFNSIVC
ncbi:MAG: polysaccharide deacetylase family protein [Colwellia sp.]|nr:polysaccharide deacetylase family protein [Colwellia sp.]